MDSERILAVVRLRTSANTTSLLFPHSSFTLSIFHWNIISSWLRCPIPDEYKKYDDYLSATDWWNDFVNVGSKIDSAKNRLHYVILARLLQDIIPSLVEESYLGLTSVGAKYPLCHPDLSVNNIFIDDDCNITCIIDWAFSTSVPFSALLTTPGLPHPRDEMTPSLIRAFRNGVEEDQHSFGKGLTTDTIGEFGLAAGRLSLYGIVHFGIRG